MSELSPVDPAVSHVAYADEGTRVIPSPWGGRVAAWPFERLFTVHYDVLRRVCAGAPQHGFAVVAIYANYLVADAALVSASASHQAVVIGRHSQAQLCLPHDAGVALRHVLARVVPVTERPVLRLLDLHSGQGFNLDGLGACEALLADSDLCVTIGSYSLLFIALDGSPWPEDAASGWAQRPRGPVTDARSPENDRQQIMPIRSDHGCSGVTIVSGLAPMMRAPAGDAPLPDGTVATVTLVHSNGESVYPVSAEQLRHGILLGRYPRCDVEAQSLWEDQAVSRVHLLIIEEGGHTLAIDVASTNGTIVDGAAQQVAIIEDDALIELGKGNLVRWRRIAGRSDDTC